MNSEAPPEGNLQFSVDIEKNEQTGQHHIRIHFRAANGMEFQIPIPHQFGMQIAQLLIQTSKQAEMLSGPKIIGATNQDLANLGLFPPDLNGPRPKIP